MIQLATAADWEDLRAMVMSSTNPIRAHCQHMAEHISILLVGSTYSMATTSPPSSTTVTIVLSHNQERYLTSIFPPRLPVLTALLHMPVYALPLEYGSLETTSLLREFPLTVEWLFVAHLQSWGQVA